MRAVQIVERGKPIFVDAPKPQLIADHAIIKTLRLSLCGSDIRHIHYLPDERYPTLTGETGHEMVGVIEAIDPAHDGFRIGQRVLCLAPDHRAMCDYYRAPIKHLLPLDQDTPLEHSVQAQQFGTVLYAAQALPDIQDKTVAIIGQGSAGLWFNFAMKQRGAAKIIALDLKDYRLNYSRRYGASHRLHNAGMSPAALRDALRASNDGQLPDVVVEAAGEADAIRMAVAAAAHDGFLLIFGVPRFETMDFPIFECFWKSLTVKARVGTIKDPGHACTRQALDYINSGAVDCASMITHTFKFEDVLEAYELHHMQDEGAVKIVIDMED